MLGAVSEVRGRGLMWREGRLVAGLGPRPAGAVLGESEPASQPLASFSSPAPTCTHPSHGEGPWGSETRAHCGGETLLLSARATTRALWPSDLENCWSVPHKSCFQSPKTAEGRGRGRDSSQNGSCPSSEASGHGGRGGRRAAEPRRRLLRSPSSLALTDGRGAPWGGLPARRGRGASARPRWGDGAKERRAAPALPTPTPGGLHR